MVAYLFQLGPRAGEGAATWGELRAWQEAAGVTLSAWQAEALIAMAREYVNQAHDATEPDCPPPYLADTPRTAEQQTKLGNSLKSALRQAASSKKSKRTK